MLIELVLSAHRKAERPTCDRATIMGLIAALAGRIDDFLWLVRPHKTDHDAGRVGRDRPRQADGQCHAG